MSTENVTCSSPTWSGRRNWRPAWRPTPPTSCAGPTSRLFVDTAASSGGTEVKNLGDGLMVVFATASAGLSCAVTMQQDVDRDNRRSDHHLGLRVGLSGGEATREGDDYFGDAVVEAARLCARAEGGQILASELVRATAGRRSPHGFQALGELELKGLPEPARHGRSRLGAGRRRRFGVPGRSLSRLV